MPRRATTREPTDACLRAPRREYWPKTRRAAKADMVEVRWKVTDPDFGFLAKPEES